MKYPSVKNITPIVIFLCAYFLTNGFTLSAQMPPQQWSKKYGGGAIDIPFSLKYTSDGGTIVAGYTDSKNGDVSAHLNREYWDLWIVKLDRCGNIQWEKSLGGTGYESARDLLETADGGFIVLGETNSTDGDVVSGYGGTKDIWLLKLTANGTLEWQKRYGGTGLDIGNQIVMLNDGNYLVVASSSSNNGDITGNHGTGGYTDGVLLKISPGGALLWSKCYGGTKNDELLDIEIINGKMYLAGYANSTDGDIPPNQKNYDVWLMELDMAGNKIFSKIYGGSQNDVAYSMSRAGDGSLTLAGYTTSSDGDVTGTKGSQDYWVLHISATGTLLWQKTLGGSDAEYATSIITDRDGGYIIGGISYSIDGDITANKGDGDFWVVKLNAAGDLVWKQNLGGSKNDYLRFITYQPVLNEYYLAGDSESGNGDFSGGHGETDFAVIKLRQPEMISIDSVVCNVNGFAVAPDTLKDVCGYDSAFVTYKPVLIRSPLDQVAKSDTIFEGQQITLPSSPFGNISWESHPTLSCTHCTNPVASPVTTTSYTAYSFLDQCNTTDNFTVVVLKDATVKLPNAFTPNGDGINDCFGPAGKVPNEFQMQVFNRSGEIVFQSSEMNSRWNGMHHGQAQPSNTFVYMVKYKNIQNQWQLRKGTVTLVR